MKKNRSREFNLLIDFWFILGQFLSVLKIFEQILQNHPITDYSIALLVLITSAALSSLKFYEEENFSNEERKGKLRKILHKIKNDIILLCAIILLVESGGIFLMTIGVPFFARYFPMEAVYFALVVIPLRQGLSILCDIFNMMRD